MDIVEQMKLFMEPRSVAIIGVTRATGEGTFNILQTLISSGFAGGLYPVNPGADQILGVEAYSSITDVPEAVDLAIIITPRAAVPGIVRECTEKGTKAIIVVTQGFAEADEEGKALQAEMLNIARAGGARLLGPNTVGVANAFHNLNTSYIRFEVQKVPLGSICQSGIFFQGVPALQLAGETIDLGNGCDVDFADGLEYFENDPNIKVIMLHIEGMRNGRRFVEVARRVAGKKPVLVLKGGRSESGARLVQSHTGALAGKDEVYEAIFKQCRLVQASDIDELYDLARTFLRLPLMRGGRLGVISATGAGGVLATDACKRYGLELAELSRQTVEALSGFFPAWAPVSNPLDIWPAVGTPGYSYRDLVRLMTRSFAADPGVDAVLFIGGTYARGQEAWDPGGAILDVVSGCKDKPVVCWLVGPWPLSEDTVADLERSGQTVVFTGCGRAVRALARLRQYSESVMADIA